MQMYRYLNTSFTSLLWPGRGAEYSDQPSVHLSVCEHISGTAGPIFTKFCVLIPCGHGSVLLWRRGDTLCTSGFMDDVTFGRNWHIYEAKDICDQNWVIFP